MNFIIPNDEVLEKSDGDLFIQLNHITKTLSELKEEFERTLDTENVAILWDAENVTPSVDSLFIEGFLEYAEQFGRITVAKALLIGLNHLF